MNWGQHPRPVRRIQRCPGGDYATRAAAADWQASTRENVSVSVIAAANCPSGIRAPRCGQVERHIAGLHRGHNRPNGKQKAEEQGKNLL